MITLPLHGDPAQHAHINRLVDIAGGVLYLIEIKADYAALPQPIKDMLINSQVTLADGSVSNQLAQLMA